MGGTVDRDPLAQRVSKLVRHCAVVGAHTTSGELGRLLAEAEDLRAPVQRLLLQRASELNQAREKLVAETERRRFDDLLPHARAYFEQGRLDEAIAACERFLDKLGDDALVRGYSHRWRALRAERKSQREAIELHMGAQRWERAAQGIKVLEALAPLPPELEDVRDALQVRMRHEQGLLELAASAEARGDRAAARRMYGKVLARRPLQEAAQRALWRLDEGGTPSGVLKRMLTLVLLLALCVGVWQGWSWWSQSSLQDELASLGNESSLNGRIAALQAFLRRNPGEPTAERWLADARADLLARDAALFQVRQQRDALVRQQLLFGLVEKYGQDLAIDAELVKVRAWLEANAEPDQVLRVGMLAAYLQAYPGDEEAYEAYHKAREILRNARLRAARELPDPRLKISALRTLLAEYRGDEALARQLQSARWEWKDSFASAPDDLAEAGKRVGQIPAFKQEFSLDARVHRLCQIVRARWLSRTMLRERPFWQASLAQTTRAASLGLPAGLKDIQGMTLLLVPPEPDGEPGPDVYFGACEVRRSDWQLVLGDPPSEGALTPGTPLGAIGWQEAVRYCNALSERWGFAPLYALEAGEVRLLAAGPGVRLPSVAEWERACRAGGSGPYSWGDTPNRALACFESDAPVAVGSFPANSWGLHDLHGNLSEWACLRLEPEAVLEDKSWILCGGSYADSGENCSVTSCAPPPLQRDARCGFRIVLVLP